MSRPTVPFNDGDVVTYKGKPMYVKKVFDEGGGRKLRMYHINDQGKLTGNPIDLYEGLYGDQIQLIDFAKIELTVHLPEQWQKMTVPTIDPDSKKDFEDDLPEAHPAYGVATISRVSGYKKLFMSSMRHHHWISLSFKRATRRRNLSEDRASAEGELIEVFFSEAQWGRFLSSIGMGDGIPCTLSYVAAKAMPDIPDRDENAVFHEEVADSARAAVQEVREIAYS